MPALLTSASSLPQVSIAVPISRRAVSSSEQSPVSSTASPPAAVISSTTDWPTSPSSSLTTTRAPSRASSIASPRPMPRPAPVTIATLPSRRDMPATLCVEGAALPLDPARRRAVAERGVDGEHRRVRLVVLGRGDRGDQLGRAVQAVRLQQPGETAAAVRPPDAGDVVVGPAGGTVDPEHGEPGELAVDVGHQAALGVDDGRAPE